MKGLIYLNLYGKGYFSGASYDETVFITPSDYKKYFSKYEAEPICELDRTSGDEVEFTDKDVEKAYLMAKNTWHEREISLGELDGKHSNVYGNVYVDFYTEASIREHYEATASDGNYLISELLSTNGYNDFEETTRIIKEIEENVRNMVDEIGFSVNVSYRVPRDKVDELNKLVEEFLRKGDDTPEEVSEK